MASESRIKVLTIGVRVTPEEKEKLKKRAESFGVSMGELCRRSIFDAIPISKVDQIAIDELAATRADLGRLGGLLKGWLAGKFTQPPPSLKGRDEVVRLLDEIRAAKNKAVEAFHKLSDKGKRR